MIAAYAYNIKLSKIFVYSGMWIDDLYKIGKLTVIQYQKLNKELHPKSPVQICMLIEYVEEQL